MQDVTAQIIENLDCFKNFNKFDRMWAVKLDTSKSIANALRIYNAIGQFIFTESSRNGIILRELINKNLAK